jgi:hypothetical protein
VKKFLSTLFLTIIVSLVAHSQTSNDTVPPQQDSPHAKPVEKRIHRAINRQDSSTAPISLDTIQKRPSAIVDTLYGWIKRIEFNLSEHPYFNFAGKPVTHPEVRRSGKNNDLMFYVLVGLFFYFALIKTVFNKYVNNLLAIFLRITLKQQQLREQLLQSPLPSLLLNILFILNGGIYISLLLDYYHQTVVNNFWLQTVYCSSLLVLIYTGKLILIKTMGWIFNIRRAADTYIFIVFLVNKMLGIFLLPFLAFIIFEPPQTQQVFVTLSLIFVVVMMLYRFFFSFNPLQNEIKWSLFQFFIYLCAFELAPLILIYKVLIAIVEKSH